jgi:hypothetical protein
MITSEDDRPDIGEPLVALGIVLVIVGLCFWVAC